MRTTCTMLDYRHRPLGNSGSDLRLLQIQPGQQNENLECTLQTHSFKPQLFGEVSYDALSYTWGDATSRTPISINGRRFLVTPNLEAALRNLRVPKTKESQRQLRFWIDAICINQEDSAERDEQVRRMKSIYQNANRVIIWLGDYNDKSDDNFQFDMNIWGVDHIEKNSETLARSALFLAGLLALEAGGRQLPEFMNELHTFKDAWNIQLWAQLSKLFQRPWFERLWIIQELSVARDPYALWGRHQAPWIILKGAAMYILHPEGTLPPPHISKILPVMGAHRITQVSLQSMLNVDPRNILTIAHNTQNAKCSNPRDRLYYILGIVEDAEDIEIDYSIPVEQVYRNWAEKRIRRTKTLDILSACADSSRSGNLPSWVPDLRHAFGQDKFLWIISQMLVRETRMPRLLLETTDPAAKFESHGLQFSDDGNKLSVSGQYIGRIVRLTGVGDVVTNLLDPTNLTVRMRQIVEGWEAIVNAPQEWWSGFFWPPAGFESALL
jgi:hypothetical protein